MQGTVYGRRVARPWRITRSYRTLRRRVLLAINIVAGIGLLFAANWAYHAFWKPTELFAPVSPAFAKTPRSTWEAYGDLFREHSTDVVSAELLAALAQVEGSGNPIARTYWRWQWSLNPLDIYRPASSAVGMFQITDGAFREARRYCIHDHRVVADGPWYDWDSCWFNIFYSRLVPSHAIEMTAAYLHQQVADAAAGSQGVRASLGQKQDLAAVIHLCGLKRGEAFVRRGFHAAPAERCGDHALLAYIQRVNALKREFVRLQTIR
jgi:hypothetical protein